MKVHSDWYADGIEDGRDLWRMDLPDVQIQVSINVTNIEDELDGSRPEYGNDGCIFIEHDVRGGGPRGDDRTKYSCDDWKCTWPQVLPLLSMSRDEVAAKLAGDIDRVKRMPSNAAMCI